MARKSRRRSRSSRSSRRRRRQRGGDLRTVEVDACTLCKLLNDQNQTVVGDAETKDLAQVTAGNMGANVILHSEGIPGGHHAAILNDKAMAELDGDVSGDTDTTEDKNEQGGGRRRRRSRRGGKRRTKRRRKSRGGKRRRRRTRRRRR